MLLLKSVMNLPKKILELEYFIKKMKDRQLRKILGSNSLGGEYIILVDSDDIVSDRMIEVLYTQIKEKNADIAIGNYLYL